MNRTDTPTPATKQGHNIDVISIGGYVAFIAAIVAFSTTVTWVCVSPMPVMFDGGVATPFLYGVIATIGLSLLAITLTYLDTKLDTERVRAYDTI